jgi:ethanolamine ammonia-lyase small subunit
MNSWLQLRQFTPARVALGRAGASMPTGTLLDFELAHAKARDAVHAALNVEVLGKGLRALGWSSLHVQSAAQDRAEYLRRPDLGRRLGSGQQPSCVSSEPELLFVLADGLSALAVERHAIPLLAVMRPWLEAWRVGPVIIAEQARVALGDEIGEILQADILAMMIGERPGLSAPDSLGVYVTYAPHVGRSDAERNCISNIRPEGLSYELAAARLLFLLQSARRLRLTGIGLKDESVTPPLSSIT